jgi:hypothetical protein
LNFVAAGALDLRPAGRLLTVERFAVRLLTGVMDESQAAADGNRVTWRVKQAAH